VSWKVDEDLVVLNFLGASGVFSTDPSLTYANWLASGAENDSDTRVEVTQTFSQIKIPFTKDQLIFYAAAAGNSVGTLYVESAENTDNTA
jgi:hypothetical protein